MRMHEAKCISFRKKKLFLTTLITNQISWTDQIPENASNACYSISELPSNMGTVVLPRVANPNPWCFRGSDPEPDFS